MEPLLRSAADLAFGEANFPLAMKLYRDSIAANENDLIYSFLHLANVCSVEGGISRADEIRDALVSAISYKTQDLAYFHKIFPELAFRVGVYFGVNVLGDLLNSAGMSQLDFDSGSGCLCIAGFPRCGTTSLGQALVHAGIAIEPIIHEPYTEALGILETGEAMNLFRNSFWSWPGATGEIGSPKWFIDKSTHWLLAEEFVGNLFSAEYKKTLVLVAVRGPVQRSLSAYFFNRMQHGCLSSLSDVVAIESCLIRELGGYKAIFSSAGLFLEFVLLLSGKGIRVPILYPSIIMQQMDELLSPFHRSQISLIDLTKGFLGQCLLPDSIVQCISHEPLPKANSSLKDSQSSEEADVITSALIGLAH